MESTTKKQPVRLWRSRLYRLDLTANQGRYRALAHGHIPRLSRKPQLIDLGHVMKLVKG